MTKTLFPVSAENIRLAANCLDGLDRYKQLLQDVSEIQSIGLPIIELTNGKSIRMHVTNEEMTTLVQRRIKEIEDDLDAMGVEYGA